MAKRVKPDRRSVDIVYGGPCGTAAGAEDDRGTAIGGTSIF
jgi:hypothetical protein